MIVSLKNGDVIIDDADYAKIREAGFRVECRARKMRDIVYKEVTVTKGDAPNRKRFTLARYILGISDRKICVDHIDRNPLNNSRTNLRTATWGQNIQNRNKSKKSTASSQYKGVCFDKSSGKWHASFGRNGKSNYLGRFEKEIDAAKAYDEAALKNFGEFAVTNFSGRDL